MRYKTGCVGILVLLIAAGCQPSAVEPTVTVVTETATEATEASTPSVTVEPIALPDGAVAQFECGEAISGIAYSPDGSMIATAGQNGITICDVQTSQLVKALQADHLSSTRPAWSPD